MEIKDLLPIGSIVLLSNAKKKLMIFGIKQSNEDADKEYDYIGVPYPEGNIGSEYQYLFNHSDISAIIFRGFEDIEHQNFRSALTDYFAKKNIWELTYYMSRLYFLYIWFEILRNEKLRKFN